MLDYWIIRVAEDTCFRWNEVQFIAVGDYKNQVSLHGFIFVTFRIPEKLSEIRKLYSVYIFFLFHILF